MWHVSLSRQAGGLWIVDPDALLPIAVTLLDGVGGDVEWWLPAGEYRPAVAHLRVPTTPAEQALIPAGLVTMDAGPAGELRPRTRFPLRS